MISISYMLYYKIDTQPSTTELQRGNGDDDDTCHNFVCPLTGARELQPHTCPTYVHFHRNTHAIRVTRTEVTLHAAPGGLHQQRVYTLASAMASRLLRNDRVWTSFRLILIVQYRNTHRTCFSSHRSAL